MEQSFPRPHELMLLDVITIMEKECEHYINYMQESYGSDVQLLKKALSRITTSKLAT